MDTKPMLLIDDNQRESIKTNTLLKKGMGAYD